MSVSRRISEAKLVPYIFTMLDDPEVDIDLLLSGLDDPVAQARLTRQVGAGSVRPEWCWLALNPAGQVVARHRWWGPQDARRPLGVDLLSVEEHDPAVQLLASARDQLGVDDAWCEVTAPTAAADGASEAHRDLVAVLTASGFAFEVARVKLERTASIDPRPDLGRLAFRPAHTLDGGMLVALFQAVANGSLDHGMTVDRDEVGAEREARERLTRARAYRGEPDWFSVAFNAEGHPVGYVVACLMEDEIAVVAEIGVAAGHRGRGYVNDLLARATRQLVAHGAERIVADTDLANAPMRAAFATAGYREERWRDDYQWRRPRTGDRATSQED